MGLFYRTNYTGFGLSVFLKPRRNFCVTVLSGTIVTRILKLNIRMDNESLKTNILVLLGVIILLCKVQ